MYFNEKANKAYIETHSKIQTEIEKLQDVLAAHDQNVRNINWAHVGDMQHILSQLKQINGEE